MFNNHSVILIIMDGWGLSNNTEGNAVAQAKTPNINKLWASFPHTQLTACGETVGLPKGEKGNSETGHLNLGAGRTVYQDLVRINMSIADGSFFKNSAFLEAAKVVKNNNSALHLMGMIGAAGAHSSTQHLLALLRLAKEEKLTRVYLHLFTDGRDSPPTAASAFLEQVETKMAELKIGKIATMMGRFWAMDRDNRWERTQKAYQAIAEGRGLTAKTPDEAIQQAYKRNETDEFIQPTVIVDHNQPIATINDKDAVIFFNFRIDRPRQLTKAFVLKNFEDYKPKKASFDPYAERYGQKIYAPLKGIKTFKRKKTYKNLYFATMTEYEKELPTKVAFPRRQIILPLAEVLSQNSNHQFHISETEKERFVTYYFDGFREQSFANEKWYEVSSPPVETYDQKPEMSAFETTQETIKRISQNRWDFILINFANPDMVGHTGILEAGIKACEATDQCVGKIVNYTLSVGGTVLITADHGNVEEMINLSTGQIDTEHSTNPVPFIVAGRKYLGQPRVLQQGILADVAPTVLKLMGINQPTIMTGRALI
ncbi:2,3-bisphosphoglycerate-independent phosphoglycerate mutase [Candidatus Shapirobacteria bacterium CG09_land_8_20_14_0_10_38_17]|uniref:2,3-bisphosphoglycerate-independent phosphoglycerate mutase n=1 Tax=Candidatus Shapirobacteria bacterium CG09_land_8_20_14_0_10_38_17 TaxID=1974884 RepID=A0A2H0WSV5_9BACT|nr:MAG: 2,3-bisphosphoglycerate-independent phosphoglycerate mutase [Candidatus Shapirobacteria bacterium CG09_land_8_20_14_0_10_38_17]